MTGAKSKMRVGMIIFAFLLSVLPELGTAQTMDNPIVISMVPLSSKVKPGTKSALILTLKVPRGYWLGSNDPAARNPSATIVEMEPRNKFNFETPLFPQTLASGVPVHKGNTQIFQGEVKVVIPFTPKPDLAESDYEITASLTYTPGLNAGQLITHIDEVYSSTVTVAKNATGGEIKIPDPALGSVPEDFLVKEEIVNLDEPWHSILYRWPEGSAVPSFLHWLWIDPENHGKHVQTVWAPFVGNTENNGLTVGGSVALMNLTAEGIMTGLFQIRLLNNENFGNSIAVEAVSCPGAYFNYWYSSEISSNGENKQVHLHIENLTLGESDEFGYELQTDIFQDPRYRFYGIGAGSDEKDKSIYSHSEAGAELDIYWLPVDHWRFGVGGKYRSVAVKDGADKLRGDVPFTTDLSGAGGKFANIAGIRGATIAGPRMSLVYDHRNSELMPTNGMYAKMTVEYNQVVDQVATGAGNVDNYGRLLLDFRNYMSTVDQRITFLIRNAWTFTSEDNIPFFDQATIGGDYSDRAFDRGRFFGRHMVFMSMEMRYQAMHMNMLGTPWTIEMAPFMDFSSIFDNDGFNGRFNVNPGMSVRMLNKPNVGMVGNIAYGQDGVILTGGVQLPF